VVYLKSFFEETHTKVWVHGLILDINPGNEDVHINEGDYQDKIDAEDDHDYLEAVEGVSCEEERPGVSDAS
jgi:hypothetical protein